MAEKVGTTINGQTCLEKRGIVERKIELEENLYSGVDYSSQYSSGHPNATSQEDSVKGKGRNGVGHLHSLPYTGTPKVNVNAIDPFNFNTTSSKGATIGGKHDIDARKEAEVRSLFKREENEYSVTNENAISDGNVHGKGTGIELDTTEGGGGYDVAQRKVLIKKNLYNNIILSNNYSPTHQNAISSPNDPKGKSTKSGGHTYFMGYYGTPGDDASLNAINYSNFVTYDDDITIGNAADVATRNELYRTRIYNHQTNPYSAKNKDALSNGDIIGKGTGLYLDTLNGGGGIDIRQRALHLMQNTWRKNDIEYSRPLVLAEYDIQTEFIVSTTDDIVQEQKEKAEAKQAAAIKKAEEKRKKREEKAAKKAAKVAGVNNSQTKTEASETTVPPEAQKAQAINYYTSPKPVDTYEGFFNAYDNQNGRFAPQQ